jgi:cell wall-associated NlpC family hydrolase
MLFKALLILLLLLSGCARPLQQIEVSKEQAQRALDFALTQINKPYVYGAQDPNVGFDCSGLIIWAYKQVIPQGKFLFEGKFVNDIDVAHLYKENCRLVQLEEVNPGDIVFIADCNGNIEHCGLVIGHEGEKVNIIHASGGLGKVVIETWEIGKEIRGGHIQNFSKLKIFI